MQPALRSNSFVELASDVGCPAYRNGHTQYFDKLRGPDELKQRCDKAVQLGGEIIGFLQ